MKDYLEVLLLALLGIGPIYQNVVKGNQDKISDIWSRKIIHCGLEN